jgi:ATP-binding cassette subfamily F protein 3
LDIQSVNILIQALQQYEGTFISVSHDRYFLDNVANKIWFIEEEKIKQYPGTYAEYEEWNSKRVIPAPKPIPVKPTTEEKKAPVAQAPANAQQQLKKLNDKLKRAEEEIAVFEAAVKAAEAELAKEEVFSNQGKLAEANKKYLAEKTLLDHAQKTWEELASEIMELEG